jgi:hypothetical protein
MPDFRDDWHAGAGMTGLFPRYDNRITRLTQLLDDSRNEIDALRQDNADLEKESGRPLKEPPTLMTT